MSEKHDFQKAYSEAHEIRSEALELKANRNEKGEPNRDDYEKASQSLQKNNEVQKIKDSEKLSEIREKIKDSGDTSYESKKKLFQ